MNISKLTETWKKTRDSQRMIVAGLLLSGVANIILALGVINQKTVVTLVPPQINESTKIGSNYADRSYAEAWALFTAQALGNVMPSSAKFLKTSIEPILSPKVYQQVMQHLERQVEQVRADHVTLYFEPRVILHEQETDKIFINGQSVLESPSGDRIRNERTYEFIFEVVKYMPNLVHVDTYRGKPRTLEEIDRMKKRGQLPNGEGARTQETGQ